jgi:hypothetical protein
MEAGKQKMENRKPRAAIIQRHVIFDSLCVPVRYPHLGSADATHRAILHFHFSIFGFLSAPND